MRSHKVSTTANIVTKDKFGKIVDGDTRHTGGISDDLIFLNTLDKNGYIINNKVVPFKSFVYNWARLMWGIGFRSAYVRVYEYLSGYSDWDYNYLNGDFLDMNSAVGDDTEGPVIGSNAAANSINTNTLGSRYTHAGGFDHSGVTHNAIASITGGYKYEIDRTFTNNMGSSQTVEEIGLVCDCDNGDPVMIARDAALGITVNNGQVLSTTHRFTAHDSEGWTKNWLEMIKGGMDEVNVNLKAVNYDTVLVTRSINPTYAIAWALYGGITDDFSGIIVGDDGTAPSCDHYCLQSHIEHGTSAGQLYYGGTYRDSQQSYSGNDAYYSIARVFHNFSGSDITVREFGLCVNGETSADYDDPNYKIMIFRNTITPVTVPDEGSMEIFKTFNFTVS